MRKYYEIIRSLPVCEQAIISTSIVWLVMMFLSSPISFVMSFALGWLAKPIIKKILISTL